MKDLVLSVIISVWLFVFLGFALHTSAHPEVFLRYTPSYFALLLVLAVSIIPAIHLTLFTLKTSTFRGCLFTPKTKLFLYAIAALILLAFTENVFRTKHLAPRTQPYTLKLENIHPFLQARLTANSNNENGDLHINAQGFRADEITKEKPANTFRVFVMGGSTVLNVGVPYDQSAPKLLQDQLQAKFPNKKIEVINAGMDGYTSEHAVIQYAFNLKDYKPDLIVMWHGINDMAASCTSGPTANGSYQSDYAHVLGPTAELFKQHFENEQYPITISSHFEVIDSIQHFFRYNFFSDINPALNPKLARNKKPDLTYDLVYFPSLTAYERNLNTFITLLNADKVPLILGNQATQYNLDSNINWYMRTTCRQDQTYPSTQSLINGMNQFNDVTARVAKQHKLTFIDFASLTPKTPEYFFDDAHETAKGNALTANELFTTIVDSKLIR